MRIRNKKWIWVVLVLAVLVGGYWYLDQSESEENGDIPISKICWKCIGDTSVSESFISGTVCGQGDAIDYPYEGEPQCSTGWVKNVSLSTQSDYHHEAIGITESKVDCSSYGEYDDLAVYTNPNYPTKFREYVEEGMNDDIDFDVYVERDLIIDDFGVLIYYNANYLYNSVLTAQYNAEYPVQGPYSDAVFRVYNTTYNGYNICKVFMYFRGLTVLNVEGLYIYSNFYWCGETVPV